METDLFVAAVESRLSDLLSARQQTAAAKEPATMIGQIQQLVLRAGKRSRPRLLHMTYRAYGGKKSKVLVDVAVALELQHQFLLVHDDIMDNDTVRYEGLNLLGHYRQEFPADKTDIAASMALMGGNLLFTFACQAILEHPDLTADQKISILALIQETNISVHAGQQLDIVNVIALRPIINEDKLLQTNFLKTASYSVQLPMQVAAELLELNNTERQKIDTFARTFGIFYQLVDDYSDYFANNSSFDTHPKYRDYKQGKITYPLLIGFKKASAADSQFLKKHAGQKDVAATTMQKVVAILEACGAQEAAKKQIDDYYTQTLQNLDLLAINDKARANFKTLLDSFQL